MRSFDEIFAISADRKGGSEALEAQLERAKTPAELAQIPDARWLSRFTQQVFSAGFNWQVIENKWDGFEAAFHGFDIGRCAFMNPDWFDELLFNKAIVRNGTKIQSVRDNAIFLSDLAAEHGTAANFFAGWPVDDYVGLLEVLKKRGARLGGATGQYALRFMGVDSFITSRDVTARLVAEGVVDKQPTSKRDMKATQEAFNIWRDQSGRGLTEISRVLAMSV